MITRATFRKGSHLSAVFARRLVHSRFSDYVDISPEVRHALAKRKPVVALESALITNGMPIPVNLSTAISEERIVRENGATPATICFLDGRVKVGIDQSQLERIADVENNHELIKISRRDIAAAVALRKSGGTTIAATMAIAHLARIKIFATGGLGGVHRNGETSWDVSADLTELGRTPVAVIASGVKSILDIGRTLEYLETQGVPVFTFGETDDFPAFFARRSGFRSPWRVDAPEAAARIIHTQFSFAMETGLLFAAPIPEEHAVDGELIQTSINQAIRESEQNGVSRRGKEATPWLLRRVAELTAGRSLKSNVALVENTAKIGAQIAVEYSKFEQQEPAEEPENSYFMTGHYVADHHPQADRSISKDQSPGASLVVVGSAAVDITAKTQSSTDAVLAVQSTSPGSVSISLGGVARNVAEAAHRSMVVQEDCVLLAPIGNDVFGQILSSETARIGMRTDGLMMTKAPTPVCNMVLDANGHLVGGVAAMEGVTELQSAEVISALRAHSPKFMAFDANLSPSTISEILQYCHGQGIQTFYEPTSAVKASAILPALKAFDNSSHDRSLSTAPVSFASPNLRELSSLYQCARSSPFNLFESARWWTAVDEMNVDVGFRAELASFARLPASEDNTKGDLTFLVEQGVVQSAIGLLPFFQHLMIKLGEKGVLVVMKIEQPQRSGWSDILTNLGKRLLVAHGLHDRCLLVVQHFPALDVAPSEIVSVTGAGDSLVGCTLAGLVNNPAAFSHPGTLHQLVASAQHAAAESLRSALAVSPSLARL